MTLLLIGADAKSAILQGIFFAYTVYALYSKQKKVYDWIDGDKFMTRLDCPYSSIQKYTSRNFSNAMLKDFRMYFICKKVWENIIDDTSNKFYWLVDLLHLHDTEKLEK